MRKKDTMQGRVNCFNYQLVLLFLSSLRLCVLFTLYTHAAMGLAPDISHPAVIAMGQNKLEVFVRGKNNHLVQRTWNGRQWSGWKNLGGYLTAAPAVTSMSPGRLDVFVRGMNGHLVQRVWNGSKWSGWINLGGDLTSSPAVASMSPGRLDVFVRGMNGHLVQRTWDGKGWSGWKNLGGDLTSAPAIVSPARNRLEVFVRGKNNHLVQRSWDGRRWSGWKNLGGDLTSAPAVAAFGPDDIHVFVRGMNGHLVQRSWDGRSWSGWENLGGALTAAPAVTASGTDRLDVFVRGMNDHLVHRWWDGQRWSGWQNLGGDLRGARKAKLRILTHNVFGLRYPRSPLLPPDHSICAVRARRFGEIVAHASPPYDIVGLQEYYSNPDADYATCDPHHLSDAVWSTGRYRNSNNYYRFYPEVFTKPNGGIGIFTLHPIVKFDDWEWSDSTAFYNVVEAVEGFIFARIEIPGTPVTVDTYIVHLSSGGDNRSKRKNQLEQLAGQISRLSCSSGNPVIVMGDFNIGGPPSPHGNPGYDDIMRTLQHPRDLWYETHPEKNGYTFDSIENNIASMQGYESQYRIDYIFVMTDPAFTNSPYKVVIGKTKDVRVVKWRVGPNNLFRANVSDHFGVEATIEIRDK